jgi:hypothetical protein
METQFKEVYDKISKDMILELLLPEDIHFIQKTKGFQEQIKNLDQMLAIDEKHIRTIYFLSSEMIQAIVHNGIFNKDVFVNCMKLFHADNKFFLMSQNLVNNGKIPKIKMKFDEVNSAFDAENSEEELTIRYKHRLKTAPMTNVSISTGVLDYARRSLNKLLYAFEKINDELSIFSVICTIDVN